MYTHEGVTVRASVNFAFKYLGRGIRCAEIGVKDGQHAKSMLDLLRPSVMYLVDVWEDITITHDVTFHDVYYAAALETCQELLRRYFNCAYMRGRSDEVLPRMLPDSLDFAYIDADHTPPAVERDVVNCVRLVRVGGIVGGHDYMVTNPLQMVSLGVYSALRSLDEVSTEEMDWWVTVTPEMKERVKHV